MITFDSEMVTYVPPSAKHFNVLLHTLDRAKAGRRGDLTGPIAKMAEHFKRRTIIVLISDFYEDPAAIEIYDRMVRETDLARQRELMRQFEKRVLDTEAHEIFLLWRYRIVPYRSYVKGWKIGPSHYVNQDLATIWLDK